MVVERIRGADIVLAENRARRSIAVAVGVSGVLWMMAELSQIVRQTELVSRWWTPFAVSILLVTGTVLVVSAFHGARMIRMAACMQVLAYLAAAATLPLACEYGDLAPDGSWLIPLVGIPAVGGVLVWPRTWPVNLVLAGVVTVAADLYVAGGPGVHSVAEDLLRTVSMEGFFAWIAARVLVTAIRLDAATAVAVRQAAVAASTEATERERARFAGLIHDNVLATLRETARVPDTAVLSRAAERTLHRLDESGGGRTGDEPVTADEVVALLRDAVAEADCAVDFRTRVDRAAAGVPRETVTALAAALGEAARNSARHAGFGGRPVTRRVEVVFDGNGVMAQFTDDGAGFEVARVAADRLGVRHSIFGRMRRVRGGDAVIRSAPGEGTTVTLRWTRADPIEPAVPTLITAHGRSGAAGLLLLEASVVFWMLGGLDFGLPAPNALIAFGLAALAGVAALLPRQDPLLWPVTWFVVVVGPVGAAVIVLGYRGPTPQFQVLWIAVATSSVLAVLAIRGRICPAALALAGMSAVLLWAGGGVGGVFAGLGVPAATVLAVAVFAAALRPTLRSFHAARAVVAQHAGAEARAAAQSRERDRQLAYFDRTARPVLELIAAGKPLSRNDVGECLLLEAQLRDRLRAPGLGSAEFVAAARGARRRGVDVTVLDDGGLEPAPDDVREVVTATAVTELDAMSAGRITVRVLPAGRKAVATIVATTADRYRRVQIDTSGSVTASTETVENDDTARAG
ncbi:hypothetical protein [Nocardia arthritidis]|uniref:hypothetical protein n=1 Tax=Nocardia arthritidis TaxID=228602 RepID=UPI001EEB3F4B|nr:hypothetical protein [Nocardia arthritidis]